MFLLLDLLIKFHLNMVKKTKTELLMEYHKAQKEVPMKQKSDDEDNKPLSKKIKEAVIEVFEFSLLPGVSSISRSELYIKITWITCQLILLGYF